MNQSYEASKMISLIGSTIVAVETEDEEGEEYASFVVRMPNGKLVLCTVLSDEEGNAPGSLDLTDYALARAATMPSLR